MLAERSRNVYICFNICDVKVYSIDKCNWFIFFSPSYSIFFFLLVLHPLYWLNILFSCWWKEGFFIVEDFLRTLHENQMIVRTNPSPNGQINTKIRIIIYTVLEVCRSIYREQYIEVKSYYWGKTIKLFYVNKDISGGVSGLGDTHSVLRLVCSRQTSVRLLAYRCIKLIYFQYRFQLYLLLFACWSSKSSADKYLLSFQLWFALHCHVV